MVESIVTAALVIIGDEILSGRTADKNINFLAKNLTELGIVLREVRVVADIEEDIIFAVNQLRKKYNYIFTSGGIGPTHDDITAEAIAKTFNQKLIKNPTAEKILHDYYKDNVNAARMKMAILPEFATLLDNPVSSAPGFKIENVFVMAGVPEIFAAMFFCAQKELTFGSKIMSQEVKTHLTESIIAQDFANLQKKYPMVTMGSYPSKEGTALVFRSSDEENLNQAKQEMQKILEQKHHL